MYFATRFSYQYDVLFYFVYVGGTLGCAGYVGLLIYLIVRRIIDHETWTEENDRPFWYFDIFPSQWLFVLASLLSIVYQAMLAFIPNENIDYAGVHAALVVIMLLQAIIGVTELVHESKYTVGILVIVNIIFMVNVISDDLAEQLEIQHELEHSRALGGEFELDFKTTKLITTSIFFANLEHIWGIFEMCQESIAHRSKRTQPMESIFSWMKRKFGCKER